MVGSPVSVSTFGSLSSPLTASGIPKAYSGIFSSAPPDGDLGVVLSMARLDGEDKEAITQLVLFPKDVAMISCIGLDFSATEKETGRGACLFRCFLVSWIRCFQVRLHGRPPLTT